MPISDDAAGLEREPDDDYDLLTFSEAGVRLQEEAVRVRAFLASAGPDTPEEDVRAARERLRALAEAVERNGPNGARLSGRPDFFGFGAEG